MKDSKPTDQLLVALWVCEVAEADLVSKFQVEYRQIQLSLSSQVSNLQS